jgi:hypothetical protein
MTAEETAMKKTIMSDWRLLGLSLLLAATGAHASVVSVLGTFTQDDNVRLIPFTLTTVGQVVVRTFSYGGGVNGAGQSIAPGGFDPIVTLFNASSGALVGESDDGLVQFINADPVTGASHDSYLALNLLSGSYLVALTEWDNFANGNLSDGFSEAGMGNFTAAFGCGVAFCDSDGTHVRARNWALDISSPALAAPEPEPFALLGIAVVALAFARTRARGAPATRAL